jgi:hypothetical protein
VGRKVCERVMHQALSRGTCRRAVLQFAAGLPRPRHRATGRAARPVTNTMSDMSDQMYKLRIVKLYTGDHSCHSIALSDS